MSSDQVGGSGRSRDRIVDVAEATRDLLTRAAQASPPLRRLEWRVLASVVVATSTWTRLRDRVYLHKLAETCGMLRSRNVGRELISLRDRGLIGYQPGRGRTAGGAGRPGMLSIAREDAGKGGAAAPLTRAREHESDGARKGGGTAPLTPPKGGGAAPVTPEERGAVRGEKGWRYAADKGGGTAPLPEEVTEESSEKNDVVVSELEIESGLAEDADRICRALTAARNLTVDGGLRRLIADVVRDTSWPVDELAGYLVDQTARPGIRNLGGYVRTLLEELPHEPPPRRPTGTAAENPFTVGRRPCEHCGQMVAAGHDCTLKCQTCKGAKVTASPGAGATVVPCPDCSEAGAA